MGVVVFDGQTGVQVSINQETRRILGNLRTPGSSVEQFIDVVTVRRADGREFSLAEFPLTQTLGTSETVRAEEIVIQVPDAEGTGIRTGNEATVVVPLVLSSWGCKSSGS